jgi:hypothetical protein
VPFLTNYTSNGLTMTTVNPDTSAPIPVLVVAGRETVTVVSTVGTAAAMATAPRAALVKTVVGCMLQSRKESLEI